MSRAYKKLQASIHNSGNIDEHVGYIKRQLDKSMRDPEVRQLAVKIVSGSYDWKPDRRSGQDVPVVKAWGKTFRAPTGEICPPRNEECEIERIWDFVVLNVRYVYDPDDIDTFATAKETLDAGGGDCDDMTILFGALLKALGFKVKARVIATKDNPDEWVHIYPVVGLAKDNPRKWIPLDCTMQGYVPGVEYDSIAAKRDYDF